jgi:hypothetical protein
MGGNKHCPNQFIKKKVSGFLGGNRVKTDTNGPEDPHNTQPMPKATQDPQGAPGQPGYQLTPAYAKQSTHREED